MELTEKDLEKIRQRFIDSAWKWYYTHNKTKTLRDNTDTVKQPFDPGSKESILKDDDII